MRDSISIRLIGIGFAGILATVGCNRSNSSPDIASHTTVSPSPAKADLETPSMADKFVRTEKEWKEQLTPQQYHVLREKGTEQPFTNEFDHHFEPGVYACAACGQELFTSETKFNSGCGWPAFYAAKAEDRVMLSEDLSHGRVRTEVTCARCGSHLGHIFDDAPQTPTGQRYCINSVSLRFIPGSVGDTEQLDR